MGVGAAKWLNLHLVRKVPDSLRGGYEDESEAGTVPADRHGDPGFVEFITGDRSWLTSVPINCFLSPLFSVPSGER
jgi:hypothetical protein